MLTQLRSAFHSLRYAYKWLSVQILAVATGLSYLSDALPDLKEALPPNWYRYALLLALLARFYKQPPDKGAAQ